MSHLSRLLAKQPAPEPAPTTDCPTCDGRGEIWECVNDGKNGCSHSNDYIYRCQDCNGTGEVPA
jgi:DnaJ-class molecular chaperone